MDDLKTDLKRGFKGGSIVFLMFIPLTIAFNFCQKLIHFIVSPLIDAMEKFLKEGKYSDTYNQNAPSEFSRAQIGYSSLSAEDQLRLKLLAQSKQN